MDERTASLRAVDLFEAPVCEQVLSLPLVEVYVNGRCLGVQNHNYRCYICNIILWKNAIIPLKNTMQSLISPFL